MLIPLVGYLHVRLKHGGRHLLAHEAHAEAASPVRALLYQGSVLGCLQLGPCITPRPHELAALGVELFHQIEPLLPGQEQRLVVDAVHGSEGSFEAGDVLLDPRPVLVQLLLEVGWSPRWRDEQGHEIQLPALPEPLGFRPLYLTQGSGHSLVFLTERNIEGF